MLAKKLKLSKAVPLLCVALVLTGCSRSEKAPEPVRSVKLVSVGASTGAFAQEYAGEVRAQVESKLGLQVSGKLLSRKVQVGERVRKGQVLAEIDAKDYLLAEGAAQAQLRSAQVQLEVSKADLLSVTVNLVTQVQLQFCQSRYALLSLLRAVYSACNLMIHCL